MEGKGLVYDFGVKVANAVKGIRNVKTEAIGAEKAVDSLHKKMNTKTKGFTDEELRNAGRAHQEKIKHSTTYAQRVEKLRAQRTARERAEHKGSMRMAGRMRLARQRMSKAYRNVTKATQQSTRANDRLGDSIKRMVRRGLAIIGVTMVLQKLKSAFMDLVNVGRGHEQMLRKNTIAFGNMKNAAAAFEFAESQIRKGNVSSSADDVMAGMRQMQNVGIDARKHFKLIADMAGSTGEQFSVAAADIEAAIGGNAQALQKYGIQANSYFARQLSVLRAYSPEIRGHVLGYLANQKQFQGGAKLQSQTMDGIILKLKEYGKWFKLSIIGRPNERGTLLNDIKKTFGKIAGFLDRHRAKIKEIADGISIVLRRLWSFVSRALAKVAGALHRSMKQSDGFLHNFKQNMMRLAVWLELIAIKFVRFLRKWKTELKILAAALAIFYVGSKLYSGLSGIGKLFKGMSLLRFAWFGPLLAVVAALTALAGLMGLAMGMTPEQMLEAAKPENIKKGMTKNFMNNVGNPVSDKWAKTKDQARNAWNDTKEFFGDDNVDRSTGDFRDNLDHSANQVPNYAPGMPGFKMEEGAINIKVEGNMDKGAAIEVGEQMAAHLESFYDNKAGREGKSKR